MHKPKQTIYCLSVTLAVLLSVHDVCGQKLHNDRRDKLMQDVKKQFGELTNPETDIFEQAINNTEVTNDADLAELRERNGALLDSIATTLPFKTWDEVHSLAFTARQQAFSFNLAGVTKQPSQEVPVARKGAKEPPQIQSTQITDIQSKINDLQTQINALDQIQTPTLAQIEQALENAIDTGKITSLDSFDEKLKALPDQFNNLKNIVQGLKARGLTRVILETTLLRYRNELARLQLQQEHFKSQKEAVEKLQRDLEAYAGTAALTSDCSTISQPGADKQFGDFFKFLEIVCRPDHKKTDTVKSYFEMLAKSKNNTALVNELVNLSLLLNLLGPERNNILQQVSNLSHDELVFQIRLMQLDAREHEVLLNGGITGLATYEAGGIKPQDIANIISMAQALATGAIAARVK